MHMYNVCIYIYVVQYDFDLISSVNMMFGCLYRLDVCVEILDVHV